MNKSPCSSRCMAARPFSGETAIASNLLLHGIFFLFSSRTRRGYMINSRPCPRVRPRGHTTQRARGEIFKLSLQSRAAWHSFLCCRRRGAAGDAGCGNRGQPGGRSNRPRPTHDIHVHLSQMLIFNMSSSSRFSTFRFTLCRL